MTNWKEFDTAHGRDEGFNKPCKVPDRVIDAPRPEDYRYKTSEEAELLPLPLQILRLKEINAELCHTHNALVIANGRLEAEKQEARKLLEEFPKFPERCVHGEEMWYCAGCQCAHERAIGEWNKLRAAILSKPTGEKSPRLDVNP